MREFRVTKYDPALRDAGGRYLKEEWTSASDVGRVFSGAKFTRNHYVAVERAYTEAARHFLEESAISFLQIRGLENQNESIGAPQEGSLVKRDNIPEIVGALLREEYWCRLESPGAFIHVGYDYYMYVGVAGPCDISIKFATEAGLFVEEFISPYHPENDG